ncbi:hypothetical protein L1887_29202 [Cichorium endivia]|nr:hypothetical protein L1887_29202 [Cichorium endivia]
MTIKILAGKELDHADKLQSRFKYMNEGPKTDDDEADITRKSMKHKCKFRKLRKRSKVKVHGEVRLDFLIVL